MKRNLCLYRNEGPNAFLKKHAKSMREGLILFERMFNLTDGGKISGASIIKMGMPRCGNKDVELQPGFQKNRKIDYSKLKIFFFLFSNMTQIIQFLIQQ